MAQFSVSEKQLPNEDTSCMYDPTYKPSRVTIRTGNVIINCDKYCKVLDGAVVEGSERFFNFWDLDFSVSESLRTLHELCRDRPKGYSMSLEERKHKDTFRYAIFEQEPVKKDISHFTDICKLEKIISLPLQWATIARKPYPLVGISFGHKGTTEATMQGEVNNMQWDAEIIPKFLVRTIKALDDSHLPELYEIYKKILTRANSGKE